MSYILDALKKSEQERGHGTAPNVQTLHSSGLSYHASKTHLWPYILLAAIVINLAALLYFILARSDGGGLAQGQPPATQAQAEVSTPSRTPSSRQATEFTQLADQGDTTIYKPVSMPGTVRSYAAESAAATQITTAQFQQARGTVLEKDELPFEIQQHIPVMEFSAHIYSNNPRQRSIVINGRFMEEGDRLASDLLLSEITPDGAIFNYQGQLFHQGVVSAWN